MDLDQVYVSAVAFGAVFVMLSVLAGLMALLTRVFPSKLEKKKPRKSAAGAGLDQELVAAVTASVAAVVPGGHVTRIEEIK